MAGLSWYGSGSHLKGDEMKCKHPQPIYTEYLISTTMWFFKDGEIDGDPWNDSHSVDRVEVTCEACGFKKSYKLPTAPAWVKALRRKTHDRFQAVTQSS